MWKFLVKNQSIEIVEREILADHQIQYVQFKFRFDGDWKRFHKVVQFSQCDEVYFVVLGTEGTTLYLPAELHAGAVKMAVFGYDTESDTTVRATTVPVTLNIRESGFEGDEPPIPPTPDLYTQLLKRIEDAEHGLDGKSAYEIAVEHGYVGTEEEWLESLKGKDGVTPDMSEYPKTSEVTTIMAIDFTTGLITASMGRSKHSKTGKLSSKAGWVGLAKKFCILLMVVVAVRMDIMIGTTYIRDATCIGFCVNELLSIIENTSLMGIPYPPAIKKAIEVLQKRASHIDDEIQEMIDDMEDDKK